jgi:hypothetical protein
MKTPRDRIARCASVELWVICTCLVLFLARAAPGAEAPLIVHEWGTFTSLQNDEGEAISGINSDDEPVPRFVHRLAYNLLLGSEVPPWICQGAPRCHPDVTMRLETPVIYFHPAEGRPAKLFDVTATFKGGWLSEYYPNAETDTKQNVFGALRSTTTSKLVWKDVQLGGDGPFPQTTDHVWTAPREVNAASVRTGGEAEKFIFYRGVAHLDAPLSIARGAHKNELLIRSHIPTEIGTGEDLRVHTLWLVNIRNDGRVAFRAMPGLTLGDADRTPATAKMEFAARDYSVGNREALQSHLMAALMSSGLFRDEAQALLNTWELSYFKSAGWRVFFLVPKPWTDFYLPLQVSIPSQITRVMVGRIELVSDEQKQALKELASFSEASIEDEKSKFWEEFYTRYSQTVNSPARAGVFEGKERLEALGFQVPKGYALYLGMGRFRNALLLDQQKNHPSKSLAHFISAHDLTGHAPSKTRIEAEIEAENFGKP